MAVESSSTDILQRLFRVPPPEFVAERNRIAKALKAEGDKDLAAAVQAVRRPSVSDWALDVTASEHPDEIAELVEAANEVIDAQEAAMQGRDSGDLRVRIKLLRVCTTAVAALASGIANRSGQTGAGSSVTDIATRLAEVTANRAALDLLSRGLLGAEDPGEADPFGLATATEAVAVPPKRTKAKLAATSQKADSQTAPGATASRAAPQPTGGLSAEERKSRRAQLAAAQRAVTSAQRVVDAAERSTTHHERLQATVERRVTEADARLAALKAELATATDQLQASRDELDGARRALISARDALREAEIALAS